MITPWRMLIVRQVFKATLRVWRRQCIVCTWPLTPSIWCYSETGERREEDQGLYCRDCSRLEDSDRVIQQIYP